METKVKLNCMECNVFAKCFSSVLSKNALEEIHKIIEFRTAEKGEIIFFENKFADSLIMIRSGDVKLEHKSDMMKPVIMKIAHSSDIIGLEAYHPSERYFSTATCLTEVSYCSVLKRDLDMNTNCEKGYCNWLFNEMLKEHFRTLSYSFHMISACAKAKLALALLSLNDSKEIVKFSKGEIASMTGLARETVSRIISKLKTEKIIVSNAREIKIIDRGRLQHLISYLRGGDN